jgi:hypothetical protein
MATKTKAAAAKADGAVDFMAAVKATAEALMSVANLTRYEVEMCHCALGEHMETVACADGEFVKFEEAMEASSNSLQQLKAEIFLLIQRTKQCACADDMGSVKGLLEQIDAKLSAV